MTTRSNEKDLSDTLVESEFPNPYRTYNLESEDWFHHENVLKKVKEIFETHPERRFIVLQGNPGSGKTSTLKRIEKTPEILGKNYIPIYLDSRKYIDFDFEDLFYSLYKDVAAQLIELGYEIPEDDYIKKRRIKGYTVESILLAVDSHLKEGDVLVLIFDEVDNLLENIDVKVISDYIQYFKHIEKNWSSYALILAGDKRLINLTRSETVNQFLAAANNINVEESLEEKNIIHLITGPVKNYLTYDDDAIHSIIWYSGKNLYFQQLICHYIVKYLIEKGGNHCSAKDVEEVIKRILKGKIKEFNYAWRKKISLEGRLLASALADESVTEKRGDSYILRENNLLDDIFGKAIYEEIENLQDLGHLNKMTKGHFSEIPFKIPLYGEWIKKEHPFVKTVFEDIQSIADKIDLDILIREVEETPASKLIPFNKEIILEIAKRWCALTNSVMEKQKTTEKKQVEEFLGIFAGLLKLNFKDDSCPTKNCYAIDIKNLNIGILDEAFCFIQDRPELTEEDIASIEDMAAAVAQDTQMKLTLFFYFKKSEKVENLVKKPWLNLTTIEENDLKKIMLSKRPEDVFKRIILSKLSLQRVSPYRTAGPAKATFYGRIGIINRIIGAYATSFAIVGARKIGKTSLLYKIKENPPPNTIYIFMDLELIFANAKSYRPFFRSLKSEIEGVLEKRNIFGKFTFGQNFSKLFDDLTRKLLQKKKKIVFIFDEIDRLIEFDQKYDYKLMRLFRAMSQKNHCQFIFAGFKELWHHKRDIRNPLYNFYEEIRLEPLDRGAALVLITKPMESMGIHYRREEDRELILEYTACHPNLIQFFCKHLVDKIDKHVNVEERRTILIEDIEELFDTKYENYILDEVYMFNTDLSNINKLILILLAEEHPNGKSYSAEEIRNKLSAHGIRVSINDVYRNLKILVMRFILLDEGRDNYKFALSVFPEILRKRIDDDFKDRTIEEIKEDEIKSL